jgi:hypothetical protein
MPIELDDPVLGQVYMSDNTRPKEIVWSCELHEVFYILFFKIFFYLN